MAAVVCITFLVAWTPYAVVSVISALIPRDEQEAESTFHAVVEESSVVVSNSSSAAKILDILSLLNLTDTEYYKQIYHNPENKWSEANNSSASISSLNDRMFRSIEDKEAEPMTRSPHLFSPLPPVVTLIPVIFAKSHCMINPLIYQIMNREFRDDIYAMVFGQENAARRRIKGTRESLYESQERELTNITDSMIPWKIDDLESRKPQGHVLNHLFFSLREDQHLLLTEREEEKEQSFTLVCGKSADKYEETEETNVHHWNKFLGQ